MDKSIKVELDTESEFDREVAAFIYEIVDREILEMDKPTIKELAKRLEIHEQRAGRLVRALGLRDRFGAAGRPTAK